MRYTLNSHASVSRLPAEVLAEVFLYVVKSSIDRDDTYFAPRTFSFLQACKRWNEVAVGFPQLWRWWIAGAVKAWPLFNSRSKNIPLSLTWRPPYPASARDILTDSRILNRIHQLDFSGTVEQLALLLSTFNSSLPPNASSVRLHIFPDDRKSRERLVRFLSLPSPKLSRLDLGNFLPSPSSPIFTTSNLTSLKLSLSPGSGNRFTPAELAQVFQLHPNLQELDLSRSGIPLSGQSNPPASFILPRLVHLRLYGAVATISGFIDLLGMSSPLHNVVIRFVFPLLSSLSALAATVKKILAAYCSGQGLNHPRKINHLTVAQNSNEDLLVFDALSRSAPESNLRLQFHRTGAPKGDAVVKETFTFFPLNDVREFSVEGPAICADRYHGLFQEMKDLCYLQLSKQDILPVLWALSPDDQGPSKAVTKTAPVHPRLHR